MAPAGNRPELVLLPGNMCDARLWAALHGLAACHADLASDDSISAMAERSLAAHPGPLVLVGFSMGGIVALEMARQAPDRIEGLILIDTNAGADLPERAAVRPVQQDRVRGGALAQIVADELKPVYLAAENRDDEGIRAAVFAMAMDLGDAVFIRQSEALRTRADLSAVLDQFTGPVLLICGSEDTLCPPAWHRAMAARCRNAELFIIPGAGHLVPLEQPRAFAAIVTDWLTRNFGD